MHPDYLSDLAGLGDDQHLIVPHLRGVGRSPAPTEVEPASFWRQAEDLECLRVHGRCRVQRLQPTEFRRAVDAFLRTVGPD